MKKHLIFLVLAYFINYGVSFGEILLSEDWESGTIDTENKWELKGSPLPAISNVGDLSYYSVNNRGDASYWSWIASKKTFNLSAGDISIHARLKHAPVREMHHMRSWLGLATAGGTNFFIHVGAKTGADFNTSEGYDQSRFIIYGHDNSSLQVIDEDWHTYQIDLDTNGYAKIYFDHELMIEGQSDIDTSLDYQFAWGGKAVWDPVLIDNIVIEQEQKSEKVINYVALGDSYSSGEGIGAPYKGCDEDHNDLENEVCTDDDDGEDEDNQCRRHDNAYSTASPGDQGASSAILSGKVVKRSFHACSGAVTKDIVGPCSDANACEWDIPDDVRQIDQPSVSDADLVTISIGGNDMGFATVLEKCVLDWDLFDEHCQDDAAPGSYDGTLEQWLWEGDRLPALYGKLKNVYKSILEETKDKPLLVFGYPKLIDESHEGTCDYPGTGEFEPEVITFLNGLADEMNLRIKCAAYDAGAMFVDVDSSFKGKHCHPENQTVAIRGTKGSPIFSSIDIHESFHPNAYGHLQYARIGQQEINKILVSGELPDSLPPQGVRPIECNIFDSQASESLEIESLAATAQDSLGELDVRVEDAGTCNDNSTEVFGDGQSLRVRGVGFADNANVTIRIIGKTETGTHWNTAPFYGLADSSGTLNESVSFDSGFDERSLIFIEAFGENPSGGERLLTTTITVEPSATTDTDADGVPDACDNCRDVPNFNQIDTDVDGIGDVCDPYPTDPDNDLDGDGIPADEDPCPFDKYNDTDNDGFCASVDNCPNDVNEDQEDQDFDGFGDVCDNCPPIPNPDQLNSNDDAIGDACDRELEHFLGYKIKHTKKTPKFESVPLSLDDEFEAKNVDVKKMESLFNPAKIFGGGVLDKDSHLVGYQIKKAKGEPKHLKQTGVLVSNELGTLIVDTKKSDSLLVPSSIGLDAPVDPLDPVNIDHFKCYSAVAKKKVCEDDPSAKCKTDDDCMTGKCSMGFPKGMQLHYVDQFEQPKSYDIKKPTKLCVQVNAGDGLIMAEDISLMCYQAKKAKKQPKHTKAEGIYVNNQFAVDQLEPDENWMADTIKEEEICIPSLLGPIEE